MEQNKQYRAAIYARYSSAGQRDESIEGQIRECREFAARNNITIVKIYADRAVSGTTTAKRDEFNQMIKDSEKGIFDAVICWKLDRFARNRYDSALNKARLKKAAVSSTHGRAYRKVRTVSFWSRCWRDSPNTTLPI